MIGVRSSRAKVGMDLEPVFSTILARWVSIVRWLIPRSNAIFLLRLPAKTSLIAGIEAGTRTVARLEKVAGIARVSVSSPNGPTPRSDG